MFYLLIAVGLVWLIVANMKSSNKKAVEVESSPRNDVESSRPRRQLALRELNAFFKRTPDFIVVLDVETNGLHAYDSSVLSIGMIKYKLVPNTLLEEVSRFERFYFPREPFNPDAIRVNGLSELVIKEKRNSATYSEHFLPDDIPAVAEFLKGVTHIVGHNIAFDIEFVPGSEKLIPFCTMKSNTDIVAVGWNSSRGNWKWPSLEETARYYSIHMRDAHESIADAEAAGAIFKAMAIRAGLVVTVTEDPDMPQP